METFETLGDAINAIVKFDREKFDAMPTHVKTELSRLAGVGISPVDRIIRTAELLYANRDSLTRNVDRLLVAGLVQFASAYGWHGINENQRALRMERVMRAAAGEELEIAEEEIPKANPDFLPPGPTPTPEAP